VLRIATAEYTTALTDARRTHDALPPGPARTGLAGVIANAEALDGSGQLAVARLPATLMTLRRNTEFWRSSQPPAPGTRVVFTGSPVLLEGATRRASRCDRCSTR